MQGLMIASKQNQDGTAEQFQQEFSTVHSALVRFMQVYDDRFQAESGWKCRAVPS
jgi:hypothetical protein